MWVHVWVIRQTNANSLKRVRQNGNGCPLRAEVVKMHRRMERQCSASCVPHDLTLSLLRLVLLPGYYFLWQHLSRRGEQRWKDSDRWPLCILLDRKSVQEGGEMRGHDGQEGRSVRSTSVWETFSSTARWCSDDVSLLKTCTLSKKKLTFRQGDRMSMTSFSCFFLQKRHPCQASKTSLLLWRPPLYNNAAEAAIS